MPKLLFYLCVYLLNAWSAEGTYNEGSVGTDLKQIKMSTAVLLIRVVTKVFRKFCSFRVRFLRGMSFSASPLSLGPTQLRGYQRTFRQNRTVRIRQWPPHQKHTNTHTQTYLLSKLRSYGAIPRLPCRFHVVMLQQRCDISSYFSGPSRIAEIGICQTKNWMAMGTGK